MWSEEIYRIFELDPAEPMTLDLIRARVHPEDDALFREVTERAQTGSDFECEHRLRMSNQSVKYVRLVAHGTRDEEGELEYVGAIQDVTPRRLSDEALDKVRAELAHITRVSSLGALTASIAHEVNSRERARPRGARSVMANVPRTLSHGCARSFVRRARRPNQLTSTRRQKRSLRYRSANCKELKSLYIRISRRIFLKSRVTVSSFNR